MSSDRWLTQELLNDIKQLSAVVKTVVPPGEQIVILKAQQSWSHFSFATSTFEFISLRPPQNIKKETDRRLVGAQGMPKEMVEEADHPG